MQAALNPFTADLAFAERARDVRADLEAGVPLTLGEIADRLGISFDELALWAAAEMFRQAPDLAGVALLHREQEAAHAHRHN